MRHGRRPYLPWLPPPTGALAPDPSSSAPDNPPEPTQLLHPLHPVRAISAGELVPPSSPSAAGVFLPTQPCAGRDASPPVRHHLRELPLDDHPCMHAPPNHTSRFASHARPPLRPAPPPHHPRWQHPSSTAAARRSPAELLELQGRKQPRLTASPLACSPSNRRHAMLPSLHHHVATSTPPGRASRATIIHAAMKLHRRSLFLRAEPSLEMKLTSPSPKTSSDSQPPRSPQAATAASTLHQHRPTPVAYPQHSTSPTGRAGANAPPPVSHHPSVPPRVRRNRKPCSAVP